jgi:hypothetical protein
MIQYIHSYPNDFVYDNKQNTKIVILQIKDTKTKKKQSFIRRLCCKFFYN